MPIEAAIRRKPNERWLHSSKIDGSRSTYSRNTFGTPHRRPMPTQLAISFRAAPVARNSSAS